MLPDAKAILDRLRTETRLISTPKPPTNLRAAAARAEAPSTPTEHIGLESEHIRGRKLNTLARKVNTFGQKLNTSPPTR